MTKKEMREVVITYCDGCTKEISPPYTSIKYPDGTKVDLCPDCVNEAEKVMKPLT